MTDFLLSERVPILSTAPEVINLELINENQEYSLTVPQNTKQFLLKTRDPHHTLKFAFKANGSFTQYVTLKGVYWETGIISRDLTIYCQSPNSMCVVEFLGWS